MTHPALSALATPGGSGVAAPLALRSAARIQERDWDQFLHTPTQLANGCRDLVDAIAPHAIVVTSAAVLAEEAAGTPLASTPHLAAALDAATRLAASLGARAAVGVTLPGVSRLTGRPATAAAEEITEAGRSAFAAGAGLLLIDDPAPPDGVVLSTLLNVARFHQAFVVAVGAGWGGLAGSTVVPLETPQPASGVVVTDGEIDPEHAGNISALSDWVYDVTA